MSASRCFRRLLIVASFTTLLFILAVLSPLLVGRMLTGESPASRDDLLVCLFIPTSADWPSHILSYALAGLLFAGVLSGLASFVKQWYRTRRIVGSLLKLAAPLDDTSWARSLVPAGLEGRVDFIRAEKPLAFCYGWLRPRVCISSGAIAGLTESEIEALILHECYHLSRRDPLKTAITRVLASTFFFLPIAGALRGQYLLAKEIEADAYALRVQGTEGPLIGALYKLIVRQAQPYKTTNLALVGAADSLSQRLDYLLDKRTPAGPRSLVLFTSSFVITTVTSIMVLTSWAAAASALWYQAHSGLGGC